ncbi:peptidoglycan-binding protein, partial [Pseudooctadecabacter sp.]|uniref:peptidoglycan-binding domain-containing protein n=1 Tax=Pseudooctadecabacter sp. TaxID=1966338 RepID=UPI0035C876B0
MTQTPAPTPTEDTPQTDPVVVAEPDPIQTPDETLREAQASEATLDRDQKRALQVALQWAGVYDGAIDGLYGRGTRRSMSAWQKANNHEVTGVLTTSQRAELLAA